MPLVVVCGKPSSGKSTLAECFCRFVGGKPRQVVLVSDNRDVSFSKSIYRDSQKEREHRAILKSEVQRLLSKDCLVICDSLNYIKGFRYELFCIAKLMQTTYCVLYCDASDDICLRLNSRKKKAERYDADDITGLFMRFEEPSTTNRWDCPLFKVEIEIDNSSQHQQRNDSSFQQYSCLIELNERKFPLEHMYQWLFEGRSLSANDSTGTTSLMPADYLHALDHITKEIVASVMQQQRTALPGDAFIVPNYILNDEKVLFTRQRSFIELSKLRRQFTTYMKMHPSNDMSKFASLFINYLNANP